MNELHEHPVDLDLVAVLHELLRTGSTTAAAQRLGRTQSAVSHALGRLRAAFGDELFVRTGRRLVPTARAEALAGPVERLLLDAAALIRPPEASFDPARLDRVFVIGGTDYADATVLPPLMRRLRAEAPGVEVRTRFLGDDIDRAIQGREVDLAFGAGFRDLAGIVEQRLYEEHLSVVVRARHPALRAKLTLDRYCALDHVLVTPRGLPGSFVDTALGELGRSRRVVLRVPSFSTAALVVAETDLIVTLPDGFARAMARLHRLKVSPLPLPLPPFKFTMAFARQQSADPAHVWLRKLAREAAESTRRRG